MCGRYVITSSPAAIRALFGYPEQPNFPPRYNVAPTQPIPVVRLQEGKRQFVLMRWGLIPSWVKDPKGFSLLINARAEFGHRQAGVSQRHAPPPLPHSGRWLLRVERSWRAQAAVFHPRENPAARLRLRDCGRPGPGQTARSWIRLRSSPQRPIAPCPRIMGECR